MQSCYPSITAARVSPPIAPSTPLVFRDTRVYRTHGGNRWFRHPNDGFAQRARHRTPNDDYIPTDNLSCHPYPKPYQPPTMPHRKAIRCGNRHRPHRALPTRRNQFLCHRRLLGAQSTRYRACPWCPCRMFMSMCLVCLILAPE